jgi:creatinine amidohydrolase
MGAEMTQVELAQMTWTQAAAGRDAGAVVLITIGTQEENGSVCPLATDTLLAFEVARRVAEQTGSLVAPPINYGYSSTFSGYPGTMSLKPDTLRRVIFDVCENLIENGFDHLMLVNCHMPNEPIMQQAAKEIGARYGILIGSFNPITLARSVSQDLYADVEATFGHGAEPIASMIRSFNSAAIHLEAGQARDPGSSRGCRLWGHLRSGWTVGSLTSISIGNRSQRPAARVTRQLRILIAVPKSCDASWTEVASSCKLSPGLM